ncbi:c-type cytochrome [Polaromonas sp. UC242_47]|uniref:SorU family sulfite dehydrogenase c-type cytochrome subunit n=1 Tax=Polaromonas sp. UC242_47 TaxID=3374626 RepID=UPI0037CB2EE5
MIFKTSSSRHLRALALPALLLSCGLAAAAGNADQLAIGKKLFSTSVPACAVCHTLKDAGAEGAVGPVLDELQPDAARVAKVLRDGLGSMPSFKTSLSEAQIQALSAYVAQASRGGK